MTYTWDRGKDLKNQRDHGVAFEDAQLVFDDPHMLIEEDRVIDNEQRFHAIGYAAGVVLLLVVHTYRGANELRVISARKAIKYERAKYEAGS